MYEYIIWSVPSEDNEGYITDQETKRVLGVDGEKCAGSKVMLQTKENPENLDQKWKRVTTDDEEFFIFVHLKSGLFLYNGQLYDHVFPTIESTF